MILLSLETVKSLVDQFVFFFLNKFKVIRDAFALLALKMMFILLILQKLLRLLRFVEMLLIKITRISLTKSFLLEPWPTFLIKEYSDILLPSIINLVNYCI